MDEGKIFLTIPEPILKKLREEMKKYAYTNMQEAIVDILRDKFYSKIEGKKKLGRPIKINEEKVLTRKKIFSKKGIKIET
ncbi:hypothetical protein HY643_02735 [Candidatus Woesearchaeota archaeon]|nr:hypothetical protein [Candidatus Woesearchaeota archaeon]